MSITTNVLIETESGREALAQRRHDVQMHQWHLLILIDRARTVDQLHQLLSDWPDLDDLLVRLQRAGMVDVLPGISPEDAATAPPFGLVAHFDRPLFDDHGGPSPAALSHICDELPPLAGMTPGLQAVATPVNEPAASDISKPRMAPVQTISAPQPAVPPELADVLPNVVKVKLIRLTVQHFSSAADVAMPLLRACKGSPQSLCDVVATCARAATPLAGEHAATKFADAAMQAIALRHWSRHRRCLRSSGKAK